MYHSIVEHKLRTIFKAINAGNVTPMLDGLAADFEYCFEGDSPIGGLRTQRDTLAQWWARLYRLFPGMQFVVGDVLVSGPPWNTRIASRLDFCVPMPDGPEYKNIVMQFMHMRWGKVTYIHTLEDTQRCMRLLEWKARCGLDEATASPLSDAPWPPAGPFLSAASSRL